MKKIIGFFLLLVYIQLIMILLSPEMTIMEILILSLIKWGIVIVSLIFFAIIWYFFFKGKSK